uniref:Trans-1,2-dihydrobenzene-1,2-diol dehydrogenase n=1 Tax=Labrus bergylta TaxID=56723 RepID=A0A3Q3F304_9LABR
NSDREAGVCGVSSVVAVAARKLEDAQEFAKKHSIPKVYGSYEELARDPDVDVVYIGVIHPCHLKTCLLYTNAKKNVLCEKPLAMNTKEVKEILASAKLNDVFFMEAVWTRFFPASVEIRRLLAPGVQAMGVCLETGNVKVTSMTVIVTLKFSRNRMAVFICSSGWKLVNDAVNVGTKGIIKGRSCPVCLRGRLRKNIINIYKVLDNLMSLFIYFFTKSNCSIPDTLRFRLRPLRDISHADSLLLAEVEDEIRRQVGVTYSQDCQ